MKRLSAIFIALVAAISLLSAKPYSVEDIVNVQLHDRHRYTANPDGILSEEAVRAIDLACDSLRTKGVAEVAVVAVREIASDDVFTFAHELFSKWGVGNRQTDNGLGILLALDKREIRFVTGEGLEGVFTDALCKRIQQRYMVAPLGAGDYDKGMVDGVAAVATLITSGELPATGDELSADELYAIIGLLAAGILIIFFVIFMVYRAAHRCPKCGKYHIRQTNSQIVKNTRAYQIVARTYICPDCGESFVRNVHIDKTPTIIVGGGGRGFGEGGGFGGGGFGGGSFGGGGAGSRF